LEAAGGGLMRRDGSPLIYGQRTPDFLVHGFVAHCGGATQAKVRAALTG
jgi:3'-phosphoadenosine 5'-phosphosulfate (PAPS) 3'-phosphatase